MRGLKFLGNSKVSVEELPDPQVGDGDVLVKVWVSTICGSEMSHYKGPQAMEGNRGHELMGVIADPNGSRRFHEGDRVGPFTLQGCGDCAWCLQGKPDHCGKVRIIANAHSDYVVSKEVWLHPLADDIDDYTGVLLAGDGLGVPYGASMRAKVGAGDITCVYGVGPVGLGMTLVQAFMGARVIAVDINPVRLELAVNMGAWRTLNSRNPEEAKSHLFEFTNGFGPHKSFECSGTQAALEMALDTTMPGGSVVLVGHGEQLINPQRLIMRRNISLLGSWMCHFSDFSGMIGMVRNGLQAGRLITSRYPLGQATEAYRRFSEGLEGKVAFVH